jgi:hypothetical protein
MTHEQRIAVLSPDEWHALITGIAERLKEWPESPIFESYDRIAAYFKDKRRTRIVSVVASEDLTEMKVDLEGVTDYPLSVAVFNDRAKGCECRWVQLEAFEGNTERIIVNGDFR